MDHIEAARDAAARIETAREVISEASRERRRHVEAARETMTAQQIADALGISRARVYAILSGKE